MSAADPPTTHRVADTRADRIGLLATVGCVVIAIIAVVGEIICRVNRVEIPTALSTIVGVAVGALAGAVPAYRPNGTHHR